MPWWWLAVVACDQAPQVQLELLGDREVVAMHLGPVEGPRALLSDGSEPDGLKVRVDPPEVAHWADGVLMADQPGAATVIVAWQGQEQSWKLDVRPSVVLTLVQPPAELVQGQQHTFQVASVPPVEPGALRWESSAPEVLSIEGGQARALAVGQAFVSVYHGNALAMSEVRVVPVPASGDSPTP